MVRTNEGSPCGLSCEILRSATGVRPPDLASNLGRWKSIAAFEKQDQVSASPPC